MRQDNAGGKRPSSGFSGWEERHTFNVPCRAFTLVEMVVVIVLVVLMFALVAPAIGQTRSESRSQECVGNIHQLGLAWQLMRVDCDGEWNRAPRDAWKYSPTSMADLAGLGYVEALDTFVCPDQTAPSRQMVGVKHSEAQTPAGTVRAYTGEMRGQSYFADEFRIPREPIEQRAVMADGIEMVTGDGPEPANHQEGANVLFADAAVQWVGKTMPEHTWALDKYKVWDEEFSSGGLVGGPGYYGISAGGFPHTTAGTWRRRGYIQNPRLLSSDPDDPNPWGGAGVGEDDIENGNGNDVDDIYYVDCDMAAYGEKYGDSCKYGFMSFSLVGRCTNREQQSPRDCSLAGGSVWVWRGEYDADYMHSTVPPEFAGMTWGHPDELK